MFYDMPLYRPPSEGDNLILQATLGCSHNLCTFCSMYRSKSFVARPLETLAAEIEALRQYWPQAHRVFLADGDAMVLPASALLELCRLLRAAFPDLQRVSAYATPSSLLKKTDEELRDLRAAGLSLLYLGIESGNDRLLKRIRKGASAAGIVEAVQRAAEAGIKVSATVISGLGGEEFWQEHITDTARVLSECSPTYASVLQLTLEEERVAPFLADFARLDGAAFKPRHDRGILQELDLLLALTRPQKPVIFRSNHASNALSLAGNLPRDNERLRSEIAEVLAGRGGVRPRWARGL